MKDIVEHLTAVGLHPVVIDENTVFPDLRPGAEQLAESPTPEAPSCFLPGTNIQFAWDSTCLGALKTCPRLYQYQYIDGWASKEENIHLRFGIEYHAALHDYERCRASNLDHGESVFQTVRALMLRCGDYPKIGPDAKPSIKVKTKTNLVRTVVWYLDQFKDDPAETIQIRDETPAMEVSFKFELDWGPSTTLVPDPIEGNDDGHLGRYNEQPYLLCGHLDRLVTFNDETFVMDRKTTTSSLSPYYFAQYEPNNQMTLYTLAGKIVLGTSVRGVIIDAAAVQVGGSWFQRGFTYRTEDQLQEWLADLKVLLAQAESYAVANHWPMNDTACDKFGGCRFRGICSKSPQVRERFLAAEFVKLPKEGRWNPLKPR